MAAASAVLAPAVATPIALAVAGAGFIAGVPHGALDHLLVSGRSGVKSLLAVIVAYAGLAAAVWALLQWAGVVALLVIVGLSAVHFGLGELEVSRQLTGWRPGPGMAAAVVIAGCGALMLPLARSGDQLREVATAISPGLAVAIGAAPVQIALALTWLFAACVALGGSLRAGHRGIAVDIAIVGVAGLIAPPLVAFALWFGGWHALRHYARILAVEPGCAALLTAERRRDAVLRLARLAALPSAAVLAALAAMIWFTTAAPDPTRALAEVLGLLLALTVPHMAVVLWLDRKAAAGQPAAVPAVDSSISPARPVTAGRRRPPVAPA